MLRFKHTALLLAALVVCASLSACQTFVSGKDDFKIVDGKLMRGTNDFTMQGFVTPDMGASGAAPDAVIPTLAHIADVGGNTFCMNLPGLSEDGSKIDPVAVQTVDAIATRAKDSRMCAIVRVLGDNTDPGFRRNAVKTAAKALYGQALAVYYIDGPDAPALAKAFKKAAPHLIVAAPENGDIRVVDTPPAEAPATPVLLAGAIPDLTLANVHFLLPGRDEDYPALDAALTHEEEKTPWTPDNTTLSEQERAEGFVSLFDGKTLNGWWILGTNKEAFHVSEDGFIEWRAKDGGALMSNKRYSDFIFRIEWKLLPGGNSGVWFRAPRGSRQSRFGFELQMMGDTDVTEPTKTSTGSIYDVVPPLCMPANKEGLWNTAEVICQGSHVRALINGQVVQDLDFDENEELRGRLDRGFIGLTDHDCYVAFRNIRIKEL